MGCLCRRPRVKEEKGTMMAIKWIIQAARKKSGTTMARRLHDEIIAAANSEGTAYDKKIEVYKTAEANRAFMNFRS